MRVLHFSDIHVGMPLGDVPVLKWLSKRALGGANLLAGRRAFFREAEAKVAALDAFRRRESIDLVLCTGDYTGLGLRQEYAFAKRAVEPLFEAPLGYVSVPGNHDYYTWDPVRKKLYERYFGEDLLETDLPDLRVDSHWPQIRLVGETVAVVAVNSARPNPQPWRSNGHIPQTQIAGLRTALDDERLRDRFVFVITHYAPRLEDGAHDTKLHGLVNADDFLDACRGGPRGAILCGHVHRRYTVAVDGLTMPVFCAGSATFEGREGIWVFEIEGDEASALPGSWNGETYELDATDAVSIRPPVTTSV